VGVLLPPELFAEIAHLIAQLLDQRLSMLTTFGLRVGMPSVVGVMLDGIPGTHLVGFHEHVHPPILPLLRGERTPPNAHPHGIAAHAELLGGLRERQAASWSLSRSVFPHRSLPRSLAIADRLPLAL
jgi:hypothetical protein